VAVEHLHAMFSREKDSSLSILLGGEAGAGVSKKESGGGMLFLPKRSSP